MATYEVQYPDGGVYEVEYPEGEGPQPTAGQPPSSKAPSEPTEAPSFLQRTGEALGAAKQAAADIPSSLKQIVTGRQLPEGVEGGLQHEVASRIEGGLGAIRGAFSPIEALLSPVTAAFREAGATVGPKTEEMAGLLGPVGLTLGLGMGAAAGKLTKTGEAAAQLLTGVEGKNYIRQIVNRDTSARDLTRMTIREESGQSIRQRAQQGVALAEDLYRWDRKTPQESLDFMNAMETGKETRMPPEDKTLAFNLRSEFMERERTLDKLGQAEGKNYIEDFIRYYFPHVFERPQQATKFLDRLISSRTAAEGSKAFLHERNIDFIQQAVDAGIRLKTWNPVEASLMKTQEIDRFIMAHNIKNAMAESGLVVKAEEGANIPADWVRLDDRLFSGDRWYAPADAAKSFNNYFSPGLKGNAIYDAIRGVTNTMTMAQLGLSGFHGLVEGVNSSISDLALALEQTKRGAPGEATINTLRAASVIGSPIRDLVAGSRMLREYMTPGSFSQYEQEARSIVAAGGRVGMDPIYLNNSVRAFEKAVRDNNWTRAVAQAVPAFFEMASRPLMQWYVPRLKLGAFQKLASDILEQAQGGGWSESQTKLAIQKAWDSIDNRFGQLVYDNLFWHKAAKDLGLIALRAPGWQIGTVRELGGGVLDLATQTGRLIADNKFDLTHRMAYSIALPIFVGYLGAAVNYMMTGEAPQGVKDYYYPRTGLLDKNGNPDRIQLPSYVRDVVSLERHPIKTVINKLSPAIDSTVGLLSNRDFHNLEIRHPGDPLEDQGSQVAKYLAEEMTPFSLRNYKQRAESMGGASLGPLIQSLAGVLPAPREFVKTPAENLASELAQRHSPAGPIPIEEAKQRDQRLTLEAGFRRGAIGVGDLVKAVGQGTITTKQAQKIMAEKDLPTITRTVRLLNPDEAFQVYKTANFKERQFIYREVSRKLINAMKERPDDSSLTSRVIEFSQLPVVPPSDQ